jgi:hypothetical protein
MKRVLVAVLLCCAGAAAGCAPVGARHTDQSSAVGAKLSAYPALDVRPFTTAAGLEAYRDNMDMVRQVFLQYVPEENLFQRISPVEVAEWSNGVLVLDATLTRAKSVSRGERVVLGILAGRAGMETEVTVTDKATGQQLAKEVILVQSRLGMGVAAGTDRETVNHMAREIIKFLQTRR